MKDETKFRTQVRKFFTDELENIAFFPIQQSSIRGDADYIGCCRGRFLWCELKTDSGKLDPLQAYKANEVSKAGGVVLIIRPSNWKQVKRFLTTINQGAIDATHLSKTE